MKVLENGKSTGQEAMFQEINLMRRPIGIVIFGDEELGDDEIELKNQVRRLCWEKVSGAIEGSNREKTINLERSRRGIRSSKAVIVVLKQADATRREEIAESLQCMGAEYVIGVFVEKPKRIARPKFGEFDRVFVVTP